MSYNHHLLKHYSVWLIYIQQNTNNWTLSKLEGEQYVTK